MNVFDTYSFEQIVRTSIAVIFLAAMFLSVAFMLWGGFLMVISGGDEERVKRAVNHIRYAALGIIVLVVIVLVVPIFLNLLKLPYGDYLTPSSIFASIQEFSAYLFSGGATYDTYDANPNSLPIDFTDL